jgi:PAS domain S-box-containing protein
VRESEADSFDYDRALAHAGLDLMACESEDSVFEVISAFISGLLPDSMVLVGQSTPEQDVFLTKDLLGVDDSIVLKAAKLLGFDPRDRRGAVDVGFRDYFAQRRLVRIPGGVAELAASQIPPQVGDLVAKAFGIRGVFTIGIADENSIFGALHIFTHDKGDDLPRHVIESFVYQCFLALRNLRTQRKLAASEEKYRVLTESSKDVVWTLDPESLRFTYVSPSVFWLRGYTPAEVMAAPMDAALTAEGSAHVRELMSERLRELQAGEIAPETFFIEELEQPCKDGSSVWTEVITSFHIDEATGRGEVRGVTRDVTERRRSKESLKVYAELLEASPASVIVFTRQGQILYANERTLEMHGYTHDEYLALNLYDIAVPDDAARIEERFNWTAEHLENSFEVEHYRADGSVFPLAVTNRVTTWEGRQVVLSVGIDITERRRFEQDLIESNARLEDMVYDVAEAMGRIVEVRDPYTQGHEVRVAKLAKLIAVDMGLSPDDITGAEMTAVVHDIGKLSVPAEILNKPGALSDIEFMLIRQHPAAGYEILKDIAFPWGVAEAVLQHHERMDGSGYPAGLLGDDICQIARILAVADVIEAMASHRPYRPALGVDAAMTEILAHPSQFDPDVVASCERLHSAGMIAW